MIPVLASDIPTEVAAPVATALCGVVAVLWKALSAERRGRAEDRAEFDAKFAAEAAKWEGLAKTYLPKPPEEAP